MKIVDLSTSIQSIYEISVSSGGQIYSIIEDTVCELDKQTGETTPVLSVSSSDCIKRIITCDLTMRTIAFMEYLSQEQLLRGISVFRCIE